MFLLTLKDSVHCAIRLGFSLFLFFSHPVCVREWTESARDNRSGGGGGRLLGLLLKLELPYELLGEKPVL